MTVGQFSWDKITEITSGICCRITGQIIVSDNACALTALVRRSLTITHTRFFRATPIPHHHYSLPRTRFTTHLVSAPCCQNFHPPTIQPSLPPSLFLGLIDFGSKCSKRILTSRSGGDKHFKIHYTCPKIASGESSGWYRKFTTSTDKLFRGEINSLASRRHQHFWPNLLELAWSCLD